MCNPSTSKKRKQFKLKATIFDKKGRVLSTGENSYSKTHPLQGRVCKEAGNDAAIFLHAEVAAIVKLKKKQKTKAHRIFIERYDENGNPKLARPCSACELALSEVGIKYIEYTIG